MADWSLAGTYLEFCSCEPGCSCNFVGFPNSKEGNCQALIAHRIESGAFDGLDLAGARVAWALWWPGAIHEGGGKGRAYVDGASDEQYEVLARIWRGGEGYALFEIFTSTLDEPTKVARAGVEMTIDDRRSRLTVDGVAEAAMTPLKNPVTGDEREVHILSTGFIWKDGSIATNERVRVDADGISFDLSGRHSVFAPFEYSS